MVEETPSGHDLAVPNGNRLYYSLAVVLAVGWARSSEHNLSSTGRDGERRNVYRDHSTGAEKRTHTHRQPQRQTQRT